MQNGTIKLLLLSRKEFQFFKNVSIDPGVIAVITKIAYFVNDRKYKAAFTIQKFFYLVIFTFKESLFSAIGNISKIYFKDCGKHL